MRERTPDRPFDLADVERAAARIAGHVHRTPVLTSRLLDRELGCSVVAKGEHLQRVGAFKARGAFSALLALDPAARAAVPCPAITSWSSKGWTRWRPRSAASSAAKLSRFSPVTPTVTTSAP